MWNSNEVGASRDLNPFNVQTANWVGQQFSNVYRSPLALREVFRKKMPRGRPWRGHKFLDQHLKRT
jgi:hypothetical protein